MKESSNKNGFTMVDHVTFDVILPTLSDSEQLVFLRIYRQTIGWKKEWDKISLSQFQRMTGIGKDRIIWAIVELEKKELIEVIRVGTRTNQYRIKLEELVVKHDKHLSSTPTS